MDHPDGNAASAWEKLKNKCEIVSAPSRVKLDKQFRELTLKKGHDPEVWIIELEDICLMIWVQAFQKINSRFMY
jgi:hypothetical protein